MSLWLPESLRRYYTKHRIWFWSGQVLLFFLIGFAFAWALKPSTEGSDSPSIEPTVTSTAEPKIWTCSMHPQIRRNKPGKCPICGMDLVPVKNSPAGMRTVAISSDARELLKIETVPVARRYVTAKVRMVGKIEYDETRLSHITAWVSGRLDRLYVDYEGVEVRKGDHLVYIYSEELYSAQEELLQALKFRQNRSDNQSTLLQPIDLVASAREKLRLLGVTASQIEEIAQRGTPTDHLTIYSPLGGIVIEKSKEEGDRVRTGDRIYTVADLSHLWVLLDAYESDLPWLRFGQRVEFTTEAYPGEVFEGQIAFIDPVLNRDTRTVKVRVNVANDDGRLKPEMFVRATVKSQVAAGGRVLDPSLAGKWISPMHPEIVKDEPGVCDICGMPLVRAETLGFVTAEPDEDSKPLVIPASAALITGKRAVVYVQIPDANEPTYEGREVVLGPRAGDFYLVRRGLKEGELVVSNGNFKLDSALQISAKPSMMTPEGGGGGGHHHGGSTMPSNQSSSEKQSKDMELSPQFLTQLERLATAFLDVGHQVEQGDLQTSSLAFRDFERELDNVQVQKVPNSMVAMWNELHMLLGNDAAIGAQAKTMDEIDSAYSSLRRDWKRTQSHFGMNSDSRQPQPDRLEVADDFRDQLGLLWEAYQPVATALAGDDLKTAQQQLSRLVSAMDRISPANLEGATAEAWSREAADMEEILRQFDGITSIKEFRSQFALLSDELSVIFRLFGVAADMTLYEIHCPMAFEGRGAIWLQEDDRPRNPYYGAAMLKCADRTERLLSH